MVQAWLTNEIDAPGWDCCCCRRCCCPRRTPRELRSRRDGRGEGCGEVMLATQMVGARHVPHAIRKVSVSLLLAYHLPCSGVLCVHRMLAWWMVDGGMLPRCGSCLPTSYRHAIEMNGVRMPHMAIGTCPYPSRCAAVARGMTDV